MTKIIEFNKKPTKDEFNDFITTSEALNEILTELAINNKLTKELLEELNLDPIKTIINLLAYNATLKQLI